MNRVLAPLVAALIALPADLRAAPEPTTPQPATGSQKSSTPPDESGELRDLMRTGVTEYKKGNLQAAREAFLQAWKIKPHYAIAASLAEVEIALGQARSAAEHLEYYLSNLPDELQEKRAAAEEELAKCRRQLARVHVTVDAPDAKVFVDDERANAAGGNELWLDPGRHVLAAEQGGIRSKPTEITLVAGETREIRLEVRPPEPAVAPPPPAPVATPMRDESSHETSHPPAYVLIGGGALALVAAGIGVGFTLDAASAQRDADQAATDTATEASAASPSQRALVSSNGQCGPQNSTPPASCARLHDDLDHVDRSHEIALGAFIAAGAIAAGTVATYFLWPTGKSKSDRVGVRVTPWISGSARGTSVSVAF